MSDSKWVNRNLRAGSLPHAGPNPLPTFRREHGRRRSSRPFLMADRKTRRNRNKTLGTRLFVIGVATVCLAVVGAMIAQTRRASHGTHNASWLHRLNPYAVDPGPDPIVHDPAAVVERFLACSTSGDLARICRQDDNSTAILERHAPAVLDWLDHHREWMPMHEAKANGIIFTVFGVAHLDQRPRPVYVVQTADGPRVDIGAFLGWSSESWADLVRGRATKAAIVRTAASRISYYNYRFNDESAWQSYRLDPLDDAQSLYGYAARGTPTATALEKLVEPGRAFPLVISLDDGERDSDHRQFRITRVLAAGWAMGPELIEDHLPQFSDEPEAVSPAPLLKPEQADPARTPSR